jgi:hypothetical protein
MDTSERLVKSYVQNESRSDLCEAARKMAQSMAVESSLTGAKESPFEQHLFHPQHPKKTKQPEAETKKCVLSEGLVLCYLTYLQGIASQQYTTRLS